MTNQFKITAKSLLKKKVARSQSRTAYKSPYWKKRQVIM